MNLKEIRDAMFAQADYSPSSSPEAITRVNGFINRAYNTLALEAPFLFFESKVELVTEPDVVPKAGIPAVPLLDRVTMAADHTLPAGASRDAWTWRTTYTLTQQQNAPDNFTLWDFGRGWDGRMIDIIANDAESTIHRHQIRSVWLNNADGYFYFTTVRPTASIGTLSTGQFKYRIHTESYPLPDNVVQLKSACFRDIDMNYPLSVFGQDEAAQRQLSGPPSQVASGIPRVIFRESHIHMRGPSVPPVASPRTVAPWRGPEPPGSFQYKVTYTWGKRDSDTKAPGLGQWDGTAITYQNTTTNTFPAPPVSSTTGDNSSRNRFRTPRFESPASPESEVATTEVVTVGDVSGFSQIKVSLPNIQYALGFLAGVAQGGTVYTRSSVPQSGVYVRIYRRRVSTNFDDYSTMTNKVIDLDKSQLDTDEGYYLLAETRVDRINDGIFVDDGTFLPDYSVRLKDIHGYQAMQFYPKPDKRYVAEIRAVVKPEKLVADTDTPWLHSEAMSVLIERAMALFYENLGQMNLAQVCTQKYREALLTLSKRYGDLRPPNTPVLRRMTRATTSYRSNHYYRKWWTTSS